MFLRWVITLVVGVGIVVSLGVCFWVDWCDIVCLCWFDCAACRILGFLVLCVDCSFLALLSAVG